MFGMVLLIIKRGGKVLDFSNTAFDLTGKLPDSTLHCYIEYTRLVVDRAMSGYYGFKRLTGAGAVTPESGYKFCVVYAVEDSILDVVGDSTMNAIVLKQGQMLAGRFTSVTRVSGYVMAYNIPTGA